MRSLVKTLPKIASLSHFFAAKHLAKWVNFYCYVCHECYPLGNWYVVMGAIVAILVIIVGSPISHGSYSCPPQPGV